MRKRQAEAFDIVLLYTDESEALTHPYLARPWPDAAPTSAFRLKGKGRRSP
ncbi:MAG: hypothetical protein ACR2KT_18370 [Methylocella sp.]